jgi:hypothetical protein
MNGVKILILMLLLSTLFACKDDKVDVFAIVYNVEFEANWSETTHPNAHPEEAGFSPFIVASHVDGIEIYTLGLPPESGIAQLAKEGDLDELEQTFSSLRNASQVIDFEIGNAINTPSSSSIEIGLGPNYQFITVLAKILPSPDWFIGAKTTLLDPQDGQWYDQVIVEAIAYKAGLDSAETFNPPYFPKETSEGILLLKEGPLTLGSDTVFGLGRFIFRRIK